MEHSSGFTFDDEYNNYELYSLLVWRSPTTSTEKNAAKMLCGIKTRIRNKITFMRMPNMSDVVDDKWFFGVSLHTACVVIAHLISFRILLSIYIMWSFLVKKLPPELLFICYFLPFATLLRLFAFSRWKNVISKMFKTIRNIKGTIQNVHFGPIFLVFQPSCISFFFFFISFSRL